MLIEDTQDVRESTAEILALANYEVETAENGKTGVKKVMDFKPDLIICDIMMPDLDGYGVLHVLSQKPETASIPFIFLTARSEKSDMRKGMNKGADDYLTKPFEEVELLDAIETRFKKNELLKVEFTKNCQGLDQFLDDITDYEDLRNLSNHRKLRRYKPKTYIYMEGNPAYFAYFIQSGKVKVFKANRSGKEYVSGIFGEGDFIGYKALIGTGSEYSESAIVLEEAGIWAVPKEDFTKLLYANKSVSNKFINLLSNNLKDREEELIRMAYDSVRKRVARKLLELYEKEGAACSADSDVVRIEISREDLAGMIGSAKETVIRAISDFRDEGLISSNKKDITILNKDQLASISSSTYL